MFALEVDIFWHADWGFGALFLLLDNPGDVVDSVDSLGLNADHEYETRNFLSCSARFNFYQIIA